MVDEARSFNEVLKPDTEFLPTSKPLQIDADKALGQAVIGSELMRVKLGIIGSPRLVQLSPDFSKLTYSGKKFSIMPESLKSIDTSNIYEVRSGWKTNNFNMLARSESFVEQYKETCCFSIILRQQHQLQKCIDLIAPAPHTARLWIVALRKLISVQQNSVAEFNERGWLMEQFQKADTNQNGVLSFDEVWALLMKLGVEIDQKFGKQLFNSATVTSTHVDGYGHKALDEREFAQFFRSLSHRQEIQNLMHWCSSTNEEYLTADDLLRFITDEQQMTNVTISDCYQAIETYETDKRNRDARVMGEAGFRKFLLKSQLCSPVTSVKQDMSLPLFHYYAFASHNTYLVGDQVKGDATEEGYVNALRKGARLIEIDAWDGKNGEPVITHGHTLVHPMQFFDAITVINKFAFVNTHWPLVISLENHCSMYNQQKMVIYMKQVFGERLYLPTTKNADNFPSPEELKNKILIQMPATAYKPLPIAGDETSASQEMSPDVEDTLLSMIALKIVNIRDVYAAVSEHRADSYANLSEIQVEKLLKADADAVVRYTSRHFMRTYPHGLRVDSSNMNPMPQILAGVQGISMNFQGFGRDADLYDGWFLQNGASGYVLKPQILREGLGPQKHYDLQRASVILRITVISGQYLPKPSTSPTSSDVIDPFVKVQLFGIGHDIKEEKTEVVRNNGFNPVWNKEFVFRIKAPEFALLRLAIFDADTVGSEFIGQCCAPVSCLRPGYGHFKLQTGHQRTQDSNATVFVRISFRKVEVIEQSLRQHDLDEICDDLKKQNPSDNCATLCYSRDSGL